jgi:hypothetical protein
LYSYTGFNRAELECNSQSYIDRVDIHVLAELNSSAIVRVIVIVLIYTFNRAELGCYGQSYSGRIDIHVLTELISGAMVRVIVIVFIYTI